MHVFDMDIGLEEQEAGSYGLTLSEGWSINSTANGGYIMAVLGNAMKSCASEALGSVREDKAAAAILTANYMGRCRPVPTEIRVSPMGVSNTFLRYESRLIQDGRECIRAMGTFMKPGDDVPDPDHAGGPEDVARWEDCIPVPAVPGYSLYNNVELRLDPVSAGWMTGRLSDRAVMKGWVGFKDHRHIDLPAAALFADCFPPCVFASRGMVAWVPTIEYSVNVRQLTASNRLRGIFTTRFISGGLVEEDGELWDEDGSLVALSRQIAKYRPAGL